MKSKVRLGCVRSTDVELGQGRSQDLISWPFRDIIRLIRDGRGEGGMEVGEEGDYIPIATLTTTTMAPLLRCAAMRAILIFH